MRVIFFSVLLLFISSYISAQQRQYSTTDRAAIKYFAQANSDLDDHMYDEAVGNLQKAVEADDKFVEAHAVLGDVLRQMRRYKESIDQFHKVIVLNPEF